MCEADTLQEQERIWDTKLKPVLLNGLLVRILNSPVFLWNALGGESYHSCSLFVDVAEVMTQYRSTRGRCS